ncbi:MAG: alpha/beta hydrolase [Duodenibacillus sp.]|nr:alpha/beta hydrolase [Duodenibacillus sp.]
MQAQPPTLAFRRYGNPAAPALLLIAGLGMPALSWPRDFIARLLDNGLQVVAPDNRDSGASPRWQRQVSFAETAAAVLKYLAGARIRADYRLEDMSDDCERLMTSLGIERFHAAGISMGGMVAQVLAARCPRRVLTLACVSSATGNPKTGLGSFSAIRAVLMPPPKDATPEQLRGHYVELMRAIGCDEDLFSPEEIDAIVDECESRGASPEALRRQLLAILASGDRRKQLRLLRLPSLVIHGLDDPLLPIAAGYELSEHLVNSRMIEIEGMGHMMPRRRLADIADVMAELCFSAAP